MKRNEISFKSIGSDLPASIVVFLVALPLCLGIALASDAPLFSGLIAGIIGGLVVGSLSGSNLSVSGPAAGLSAIVAAAILKLPSFEAFLFAVVICGVLQIALGYLKAGVIGDFVPNGVIKGMLAAIGLILILNQFPYLLGDFSKFNLDESVRQGSSEGTLFTNFANSFFNITPVALFIGGTCLVFYFMWEKFTAKKTGFLKLLPAPLLVVFIGVGLNLILDGNGLHGDHLVSIPKAASAGEFFSFFTSPDFSVFANKEVWVVGVTLALVASLETLLSIEAVDDLDPYQRVTNKERELKAQGVGNILSGLIGGLPITSVIVRSSANLNSGAKTKLSTIMHGMLILVSIALIPGILNMIPKCALAAILIFTGYKLARPALFKEFYSRGWNQFLPFIITIAAILLTDLLVGVLVGIGVGIFFIIRTNFKSSLVVVQHENKFLFRLKKDVTFLNKPIIKNKLEEVPHNSSVIIDTCHASFIDKDIIEVIEDFIISAPLKKIKVEVKMNPYKTHGLDEQLVQDINMKADYIRTHHKKLEKLEQETIK
jgi:MFS superfamily sulfate permease-like transporter